MYAYTYIYQNNCIAVLSRHGHFIIGGQFIMLQNMCTISFKLATYVIIALAWYNHITIKHIHAYKCHMPISAICYHCDSKISSPPHLVHLWDYCSWLIQWDLFYVHPICEIKQRLYIQIWDPHIAIVMIYAWPQ